MKPSTWACHPSGTTIVLSSCSTIAGPSSIAPTGKALRSQIAVSVAVSDVNQTSRLPFRAAPGAVACVTFCSTTGSYLGTATRARTR